MVSVGTYKSDQCYPRVVRAFEQILAKGIIVEPVAVFMQMELLTTQGYEDWRFGRIPYLERAMVCGLPKCKRIVGIIGFHAHDLDMVPRPTLYRKWGKGKKVDLRFTKNEDVRLEKACARCFKWNRRLSYCEWREIQRESYD